ncbi:hypothetical protein DNTS_012922 [Danionella cerebrum]|uniref:Uncharacterized protein n=1 Tax=Danionella cerebrum TaxID=2873325 RepID=A0A553PEN3_9TELE|nr:hypothetical protein DNTS_012922 [Danionella translucida]
MTAARLVPHCTPEERESGWDRALEISLPTGSSLLISPLLPSRGVLHQPRSQLNINKRSRIAYSDEVRNELLGDDASSSESQRAHLLDNTERLERSSRRLEAGYQIAVETEWVGAQPLGPSPGPKVHAEPATKAVAMVAKLSSPAVVTKAEDVRTL